MDSHFTVTIHDDNGVKQYNLHNFVKKAILYAVLFLGVVGLISIGTILYLNNEVDAIEAKRQSEIGKYKELQEKNYELYSNIKNTQQKLEEKKTELDMMEEYTKINMYLLYNYK